MAAPAPGEPPAPADPTGQRGPDAPARPGAARAAADGPADEARPGHGPTRRHRLFAAAAFVAPVVAAGVLGSRFPPTGARGRWYRSLDKPPFQPPPAVFGPVWTGLYATIAASGYRVWAAPDQRARRPALALWGAQMTANAAWTPTFFGWRRPKLALAVLGVQLATTAAYAATAARVDRPAAALITPYLGWSAFAGVLNEEIVRRNPGT